MEITEDIILLPIKASSAIAEAIYDQRECTLMVVMGLGKASKAEQAADFGKAVVHENVPLSVALGFVGAESVGAYYNTAVRGLYPTKK